MSEITVAEDVLTAQPGGVSEFPPFFSCWRGPVLFRISPPGLASGGADMALIGRAAQAAAERFRLVTRLGVELPGAFAAVGDVVVPDTVIAPRVFEGGIVVGLESLDGTELAQANTALRVLLGELHSRNVEARVSCPPEGVDPDRLLVWQDPGGAPHVGEATTDARPADTAPQRWYVQRHVHTVTTTGVGYTDLEWLRPDRTWSRTREGALTWEDTPGSIKMIGDFVLRLREELGEDPEAEDTLAVLLRPDEDDPMSMPPNAVRNHGHTWQIPLTL